MKSFFTITFSLLCCFIFGQTNPQVIFSSPDLIQGTGQIGTTIEISTDSDFTSEHQVAVDNKGEFKFTFPTSLTVGNNIIIWSVNSKKEISQRILVKIQQPDLILQNFSNGNLSTRNIANYSVAGKTVKYKATIWNTNFSIPLARFNFTKDVQQKNGDLLLFNSIGAGFGISAGELSETRDIQGNLINQEFVNTLGLHLGFLFSAGTGDDTKNVFAPTLNFSVLDFQIGVGYELGTLSENQRPTFLTLSYAIPLYKLKKGSFWIWKNSKPINDPMQSRLGE
ncbi:hypothetical protein [Polaribacter sp. 20A6]|uniref:hypothetical protein n=1 Tax=Polaribacter sp. 20A6 TaxID=2687289 RepID=UPI0013FD7DFD|nr:hypothetical protein [Polaribacter sp. 20A6]